MYKVDKDLLAIQEARICLEEAEEAAKELKNMEQKDLDKIVAKMVETISPFTKELAEKAVMETNYGRVQDKWLKNRFVCEYISQHLSNQQYVGVIKEDQAEKTVEIGVPVGVVVAMIPATSPVSTAIHHALIAIKAGNAVIFSPHPRAKQTIQQTVKLLKEAAVLAGLPDGGIHCMNLISSKSIDELITSEKTGLTLATGIPQLLPKLKKTGQPFIYGDSGNGPVFIEKSCHLKQAVHDVIQSKTFDNGVVSAAEQSVVLDGPIAEQAKKEFKKQGAYFLSEEESNKLLAILLKKNGELNPENIGSSALYLAQQADISVPNTTRLFIYEQAFVSQDNPFSKEILAPILALFVEPNWQEACDKCIELLMTETKSHTLVIHSQDEKVIREFALKKPVARILVNTPSSLGGMGATTNLFPSMTLGSMMSGIAQTSDNITPEHLIRKRKVGYGVRNFEDCFMEISQSESSMCKQPRDQTKDVEQLLKKIINELRE